MERSAILEKIKITETDIRKKIENAQQKKNETLEKAKKLAKKSEVDSETKIKKENEDVLKLAKKDIEKEKRIIIEKGKAEAESIRKKANVRGAKEFFIIKFKEHVDV